MDSQHFTSQRIIDRNEGFVVVGISTILLVNPAAQTKLYCNEFCLVWCISPSKQIVQTKFVHSFFSIFSIYSFRKEEQLRLENSLGKLTLGDITTVNMTMINGGVQHNVVPEQLSASFDIRLTPSLSLDDFKRKLDQWALNAGGQIEVSLQKLTFFVSFIFPK